MCCPPGSPCSNGTCSGPCATCSALGEPCCFDPFNGLYGCAPVGYQCCPTGAACPPNTVCCNAAPGNSACCSPGATCCSNGIDGWCCPNPNPICGSLSNLCCSMTQNGVLVCG
jgi:hypothetical protein